MHALMFVHVVYLYILVTIYLVHLYKNLKLRSKAAGHNSITTLFAYMYVCEDYTTTMTACHNTISLRPLCLSNLARGVINHRLA